MSALALHQPPTPPPPTEQATGDAPPAAAGPSKPKPAERPKPLTVGRVDAAAMVGVSVATFDRLDARGGTPRAVMIAGRKLYRVADLARWVELGCPDRREFDARTATPAAVRPAVRGRVAR